MIRTLSHFAASLLCDTRMQERQYPGIDMAAGLCSSAAPTPNTWLPYRAEAKQKRHAMLLATAD